MDRRTFLVGAYSSAFASMCCPARGRETSLVELAREKRLLFGAAVSSNTLFSDERLRSLVSEEVGLVAPEYEMKRGVIETSPGVFSFKNLDRIVGFANRLKIGMRGHPLVWYKANPTWLEDKLQSTTSGREKLLTSYISTVMQRYRSDITSWDVVNEPIEPREGAANGLRIDNLWYRAFGEQYIDIAFAAAHDAMPNGTLFLNEYSIESESDQNEKRRVALLNLIARLKKRNVPIGGIGIQGHLQPFVNKFSADRYRRFLRELENFGIAILITELDVMDRGARVGPEERDRYCAAVAKDFLDISFSSPKLEGVLTWGLTDKYSWVRQQSDFQRSDGVPLRSLPFDDNYQAKPMYYSIKAALAAAPVRPR